MEKYITTDPDIQPKINSKTNLLLISFILINAILLALAIEFIALYAREKNKSKDNENNTKNNSTTITEELSLWNDREPKKNPYKFHSSNNK